jgi:hypothetical protein
MLKSIFANSGKFWNWLVVSSVDPSSVALSIQGIFSMTIVQTLFGLLPVIGIHPTFTLAMLSAGITSAIYTIATIVTSLVTLYGLLRKAIVTIHGLVPAPITSASLAAPKPLTPINNTGVASPASTLPQ